MRTLEGRRTYKEMPDGEQRKDKYEMRTRRCTRDRNPQRRSEWAVASPTPAGVVAQTGVAVSVT